MYKLRVTKKKPYYIEFTISGDFPEEALRAVNLTDVTTIECIADISTEWDYDLPMSYIDGDIYVKNSDAKWENAEKLLELTGTRYLVEEYVEDMPDVFYTDYKADLQAAAADFRMDD